jgi:hypothetical protein
MLEINNQNHIVEALVLSQMHVAHQFEDLIVEAPV